MLKWLAVNARVAGLVEFYSVEELKAEWLAIDAAMKQIASTGGVVQVQLSQNSQSVSYSTANIADAQQRQQDIMVALKIKRGGSASRGVI